MYVRLDSGTKDLVIAWYPLDEIVRKSIRKYAGQFIRRRIRLIYEGTDQIVLTDEKWLSFIIEQLLFQCSEVYAERNSDDHCQ